MATQTPESARYDPYDLTIDIDPYPAWSRLRDECPPFVVAAEPGLLCSLDLPVTAPVGVFG